MLLPKVKDGLLWDLQYYGGAESIAKYYIAVGQSTIYFQKFNVVYKESLYSHQYMQNILAPLNEGISMRSKYANYGIIDNSFTFTIPLYLRNASNSKS